MAILVVAIGYILLWPNLPGVTLTAGGLVPTLLFIALGVWPTVAARQALGRAGKAHDRGLRYTGWFAVWLVAGTIAQRVLERPVDDVVQALCVTIAFVAVAWPLVRPHAAERIDEDLPTRAR